MGYSVALLLDLTVDGGPADSSVGDAPILARSDIHLPSASEVGVSHPGQSGKRGGCKLITRWVLNTRVFPEASLCVFRVLGLEVGPSGGTTFLLHPSEQIPPQRFPTTSLCEALKSVKLIKAT